MGASTANTALGTLFAWNVLSRPVQNELGVDARWAAAVLSVALATFTLAVLLAGRRPQRRSLRRRMAVAAPAAVAGLLLTAAATGPAGLLVGFGVGFGAASGVGYAAALQTAGGRPSGFRGTALGVTVGAYAAGPMLVAPPLAAAVERHGWRLATVGLAVTVGVLVATGAVLIRPGAAPWTPPALAGGDEPRLMRSLWLLLGVGSAPGLFAFALAGEIAPAASTAAAAGTAVPALAGGNLAGRLGAGRWADRVGADRLLVVTGGLTAITCTVLAVGVPRSASLLALGALGGTYGATSALVPAATVDLVGPARLPSVYGRIFTAWGIAGLCAPAVGAWLVASTGGFRTPFVVGAGLATVAALTARRIRRLRPAA